MKLTSKRIILRPRLKKDEKRFIELANDLHIGRFTHVPQPYTKKHFNQYSNLAKEKTRKKEEYPFVIALKKTNEFIGTITVRPNGRDNHGTIGYWMGQPYRGQGYTTEACKLIINFAFNKLNLNKIVIEASAENPASQKIAKKLGMKLEGKLREKALLGGKYHDIHHYGMLKKEWNPKKVKT